MMKKKRVIDPTDLGYSQKIKMILQNHEARLRKMESEVFERQAKVWMDLNKESLDKKGIPICPVCYHEMQDMGKGSWWCKCMPPHLRMAMLSL